MDSFVVHVPKAIMLSGQVQRVGCCLPIPLLCCQTSCRGLCPFVSKYSCCVAVAGCLKWFDGLTESSFPPVQQNLMYDLVWLHRAKSCHHWHKMYVIDVGCQTVWWGWWILPNLHWMTRRSRLCRLTLEGPLEILLCSDVIFRDVYCVIAS